MPAKKQVILNPFVAEFVYAAIVNSSIEQRRQLNGKFLYATRTPKKAKAFSINSSDEEKAILLSKLGIDFAWTFNLNKDKLDQIIEAAGGKTMSQLNKMMIDEKVMVVTNKQVMTFLGLMASNCHSETWMLNRDYLLFGYQAKQWRKVADPPLNREVKESLVEMRNMAQLMLNTIMASKSIEGMFHINEPAMAVLLYFLSRQKEFIGEHEMKMYFRSLYRDFRIVVSLKILIEGRMIEKRMDAQKPEYRITGIGVSTAMHFQKKVFALINF